jgi:hypothetical protein
MNGRFHDVTLRSALLILTSWVAVGAISGVTVYRVMRHPPAEESAQEGGDGAAVLQDPSALAVQDDLSRSRSGRSASREASSNEQRQAKSAGNTGAGQGADETVSSAGRVRDDETARRAALQEAAAAAEAARELQRANRRAVYAGILSGTTAWDSLTPEVLGVLGADEIAAGLEKVRAMPWGPEANRALQSLLSRWAEMDPRAAAGYALSLDSNRAGGNAIREIWRRWADQDAGAAMDWYFDNLHDQAAMLAPNLRAVFTRLAGMDTARALVEAWRLPDALSGEALRAIVSQTALDGNLDSLRNIVAAMVPGNQRNAMVSAIVQEYAIYQPGEAVRWINMLEDTKVRNYAVDKLVSVWGYDRPDQVARWVSSLPDEAMRGRTAGTLMRGWSATEPEAAGAWLITLPPSPSNDSALSTYVKNTMHDDPARAITFVERITDPKTRRKLAISVGQEWSQSNPDQARAYFQASAWDASIRNRFL